MEVRDLDHKMDSPSGGQDSVVENSPICDTLKEPLSVDTSDTVSLDSDKLRYIPGSNSSSASSPAKESSGSTTPTGKVSPPTTPTSTAQDAEESQTPPPEMTPPPEQSPPPEQTTPTGSQSGSTEVAPGKQGRPNRPGITWRVNGKLEAMDFQKKWYPARIVDIDDKDHTALVHFDGWNQRYDEWMDMRSERIRPLQRHSGRKEKTNTKSKNANKNDKMEHKLGDNVFAKWTDCRMYAGTIVGVNPNGSYDVLFYDGFKKSVQPINVKTMSLEVQKEYAEAGILPDPNKRPRQKLQMISKLEREAQSDDKTPHGEKSAGSSDPKVEAGSSTPATGKFHKKHPEKMKRRSKLEAGEAGPSEPNNKSPTVTPPTKKSKLLIGGNFQIKKVKTHTGKAVFRNRELKQESPSPKEDKVSESTEQRKPKVLGMKPAKPTGTDRITGKSRPKVKNTARKQTKSKFPTYQASDDSSDEDLSLAPLSTHKHAGGHSTEPGSSTTAPAASNLVVVQPPKAFKVEEEHNKCKCPFENCNKSFRKMNLVEYHIKYYHTEDEKPPQATPTSRKRKKTLSVCSSDSEMSAGGRLHSMTHSHKKRKDTVSSTSFDLPTEHPGLSGLEDVMLHDLSEVETHTTTTTEEQDQAEQSFPDESLELSNLLMDQLNKDELVNCICQINEENGLMIQCDVCLCWQHAVCMELTEETLPSKYICYVCANPPGVRDSARFSYDQDWLKQGTMARFGFLPSDPFLPQKSQIMQATHSLVADVLGVQRVLRSCDCQLDVLQDKSHPEVKFWYKNWDKIIAEEKLKDVKVSKSSVKDIGQGNAEVKGEVDISEVNEPSTKPEIDIAVSKNLTTAEGRDESDMSACKQELTDPKDQSGLKTNESSSSLSSLPSLTSDEGIQPSTSTCSASATTKTLSEPAAVVTVKEEPFVSCEENLLHHISSMQDNVESRLDLIEEQITALESADDNGNNHSGGDILRDVPRVKKAIHQILNDLVHVKQMSLYH